MKIESNASNFEEWLKELEEHEHSQPEDMYIVEVSAKLMCIILRKALEKK